MAMTLIGKAIRAASNSRQAERAAAGWKSAGWEFIGDHGSSAGRPHHGLSRAPGWVRDATPRVAAVTIGGRRGRIINGRRWQ